MRKLMSGSSDRQRGSSHLDMMSVALEPEQQEVVDMPPDGRHVLITAPPGSGKTLTITRRMSRLLADKLAEPEQILALTFTERAAEEMAHRLERMVRPGVSAMTFHGWCLTVLREFGPEAGVPVPVRIMTELEANAVVREVGARVGMPRLPNVRPEAF